MKEALREARQVLEEDEIPFGAVVGSAGRISPETINNLIDYAGHGVKSFLHTLYNKGIPSSLRENF